MVSKTRLKNGRYFDRDVCGWSAADNREQLSNSFTWQFRLNFRLIRWSASSGKRPRRLPPQIRPTLRRVKRARNEISGGWRRSGGRGEREQKRNVRAHLLSVHPSSCVTRLPLRFIPGRRARSMDVLYIYIFF